MIRRPPRSTRTDTLFPYTTLFRSACLFSADGVSAAEHFSSLRRSLSGQSQGQGFFLHGSILDDGFCPVDVSRVAARYRTEPACADQAAVSHGPALPDGPAPHLRSDVRRVGKECVRKCRSRW